MELFIGSYGYRYSDPLGAYVAKSAEAVDKAVEAALRYERKEMPSYCDRKHGRNDLKRNCALCNPDLVTYGTWPVYSAKELGGLRNAIRVMQDLKAGTVALLGYY